MSSYDITGHRMQEIEFAEGHPSVELRGKVAFQCECGWHVEPPESLEPPFNVMAARMRAYDHLAEALLWRCGE